jgi:hypothetical protein
MSVNKKVDLKPPRIIPMQVLTNVRFVKVNDNKRRLMKGEDFKYDVRTFVNVSMYPQYNNNIIIKKEKKKGLPNLKSKEENILVIH